MWDRQHSLKYTLYKFFEILHYLSEKRNEQDATNIWILEFTNV